MSRTAVSSRKDRFRRALKRFVIYLLLLALALVFGGFLAFSNHVNRAKPMPAMPQADGIVVWTGKGGGRLAAGGHLLDKGHGERLLISGVNAQTPREDVTELLGLTEKLAACCLDLDYAAVNTVGNAHETAIWTRALGYEHIILVTSDYHMPRAQVELSVAAPDLRLTPYPVASERRVELKRLMTEYGKLLLTYARSPRST